MYEATKCNGCGNDLNESLDPDTNWWVDDETVCRACAAMDMVTRDAQHDHKEDKYIKNKIEFMDGRKFNVTPLYE